MIENLEQSQDGDYHLSKIYLHVSNNVWDATIRAKYGGIRNHALYRTRLTWPLQYIWLISYVDGWDFKAKDVIFAGFLYWEGITDVNF